VGSAPDRLSTEPLELAPDERDDPAGIPHDSRRRHAKHTISEPPKIPVPARIGGALVEVDVTINFHDEPHRGRNEVSDVAVAEDDLPPK